MTKINPLISDLIKFLNDSPTAWHAVQEISKQLIHHQFVELKESEPWKIVPGKSYFVERNGSSLCAFTIPTSKPDKIRIMASHTDSPGFKLKPNPEIRKQGSILLGTEVYGSPLLSSWLNRDLGLAGRIIFTDKKNKLCEELVILTDHPLMIPQLAIHLDREVNEKGLLLNKQEHLNALAALEANFSSEKPYLESLLREKINFDQLIDFDLFLFPLEKARLIGYREQLIASYRLDSLSSVHAICQALIHQKKPLSQDIRMGIFWDNEEIGSHTAQGAESSFFNQTLERIVMALDRSREEYFCLLNKSTCISVDLAHAVNPNFADKHDSQHQLQLGKGIVVKHNAQQRYATDARSAVPVHVIANVEQIPLQRFVSRNDIVSGAAIGPLLACVSGMPTVDIGCGQLSMHSIREIISCQDHIWLCELLSKLMQTPEWPQALK